MITDTMLVEHQEIEEDVAGGVPGEIGAILNWHLAAHVYPQRLGRLFNAQTDFDLGAIGRRQPDLAFVALHRLPVNVLDAVPLAPDLAVEVVSKTDRAYDVDTKVDEYLAAGVSLVWVVRPLRKVVEVYSQAHPLLRVRTQADDLDGDTVLPGFTLKVATLFP